MVWSKAEVRERSGVKLEDGSIMQFLPFEAHEFEFKSAKIEGKDGWFYEGYASTFGNVDSYNDQVVAGAFKKTIKERGPKKGRGGAITSKIKSLWQHNPDWPMGLPHLLEEDEKGLFHRTFVPATPNGENETRKEYMTSGIVDALSIGFMTLDAELEDEEDFWSLRYLKEIFLYEFSPVTFPADEKALITLIQKNRQLAQATKSFEHGRIVENAWATKGILGPAVEEALTILTRAAATLEAKSHGGTNNPPPVDSEVRGEEEVAQTVEESETEEVEIIESSEEDPELLSALEDFALSLRARTLTRKVKA